MSKVEEVARALAVSAHGTDESWRGWLSEARAAIAAMREPSDAMVAAGRGATLGHVWTAMIDATLQE